MRIHFLRAATCAALLLGSCKITPPEGFVPVPSQRGRDYEALSADGAIFTVSAYESPEEATVEFWLKAAKRELIERRGYELLEEQAVSSKKGKPGHEILLKTPPSLGDQRYLVTLFLEERWGTNYVHVAEAAGPVALLEPQIAMIRSAMADNL